LGASSKILLGKDIDYFLKKKLSKHAPKTTKQKLPDEYSKIHKHAYN